MIIGLVGKPSSGKSTFFKSSTLANVEISPRPFTTIKPNHGTAYVSLECIDKEFNTRCQPRFGFCIEHKRFVPVDISGTTNEKGEPAQNHPPEKDIEFLEYELDQWYLSILKKGWDKFSRAIQQEHQNIVKALAKQLSGLKVSELMVEQSIKKLKLSENPTSWSEDSLFSLAKELRKLSKPMIIAANKIDMP